MGRLKVKFIVWLPFEWETISLFSLYCINIVNILGMNHIVAKQQQKNGTTDSVYIIQTCFYFFSQTSWGLLVNKLYKEGNKCILYLSWQLRILTFWSLFSGAN